LRRFIHIIGIYATAIMLAITLLGCISFESECPTPPAKKLRMGDLPAPTSQPATPSPSQPAAPRQRILIPGLSSATTPAAVERIQEYLPGAEVRVYAGTGQAGGIDGPGSEASFDGPFALATDAEGNLYVAELGGGRIRIIDPTGSVWTWVGTSSADKQWPDGLNSPFLHPRGIAVRSKGQVYIVDDRHGLSLVEEGRLVHLSSGITGFRDGPVAEAAFNVPGDIAMGPGGVICLSDTLNNRVRMLSAAGMVGTLAGSGSYGNRDGPALEAEFTHPNGLAFDAKGQLYIADGGPIGASSVGANACIRVLSPAGEVNTYAGANESGYIDGPSAQARFNVPLLGLAFDGRDNLFVADMNNHVVRVVTREGQVLTVAGTGEYGLRSGTGAQAMLGLPADIAWDGHDNLYVADYGQNVIWQITLPDSSSNS
jgi:DNA-binding beta-propeller fold protein YncE